MGNVAKGPENINLISPLTIYIALMVSLLTYPWYVDHILFTTLVSVFFFFPRWFSWIIFENNPFHDSVLSKIQGLILLLTLLLDIELYYRVEILFLFYVISSCLYFFILRFEGTEFVKGLVLEFIVPFLAIYQNFDQFGIVFSRYIPIIIILSIALAALVNLKLLPPNDKTEEESKL